MRRATITQRNVAAIISVREILAMCWPTATFDVLANCDN